LALVHRHRVVVLLVLVSGLSLAADPPDDRPRLHLIATGGSIAGRDDGRLGAAELLAIAPGIDRIARVEAEQLRNVSSSLLTLADWIAVSRRIRERFAADRDLAGLLVTCGTDTLEELAYFLHLTVADARPVVVVGAMRTPDARGYDGGANLAAAVRTAAARGARTQGVLVVMNGEIHSARDVSKADAARLSAFESPAAGRLGLVRPERVVFERRAAKRHTLSSEFDVGSLGELPRVDVVLFYQGASGDLIQAALDRGARGVIVAVAGADVSGGTMGSAIARAAGQRVPVVLATRTGSGRVSLGNAQPGPFDRLLDADELPFVVSAEDLPPLKARILLMLGLTKTRDPREIQRMFNEY
jgi:L-asparaginase